MPARRNQGRFFAPAAAGFACAVLAACAAPAAAADAGADDDAGARAALKLLCDEALQSAVRTPFGWGWNATEAAPPPDVPADNRKPPTARRPKPPEPLIEAVPTAAVGVQLLWAGELLGDDRYRQAAREAARGLAAIQNPTGQVRSRGQPGKAGGSKDPLTEVPDRAPTRAALALWLALLDSDTKAAAREKRDAPGEPLTGARARGAGAGPARPPARDERTRPAAAAAPHWLARQQTPAGGWAVLHPPDAARGKGTRLMRLDDPEYRDTALAVLLASDVLEDAHLKVVFDRSMDALLNCRVAAGRDPRPALWQAAYGLDGAPQQKFIDLPQGIDLLASRRAMEVCLAGHLLASNEKAADALSDAAAALSTLPRRGETWHRHYDRRGRSLDATPGPATRPSGVFEDPAKAIPPAAPAEAPLGIRPALLAADQIRRGDDAELRASLGRGFTLTQRLTALMCGTSGQLLDEDDPEQGHASRESERVRELWLAHQKLAAGGKS